MLCLKFWPKVQQLSLLHVLYVLHDMPKSTFKCRNFFFFLSLWYLSHTEIIGSLNLSCLCGVFGLGGVDGGKLGGNCGTDVRTRISKSTPFIYLAFYNHLMLIVRQISQSIHWIATEQAAWKNLWSKNIRIHRVVRKIGSFTYEK